MRIVEQNLTGVYLIDIEPRTDERGFFARTFCEQELSAVGCVSRFPQHSVSFNRLRGTVRGMHFQAEPHGETKIVRCASGAVYDVVVDLRPNSPTYCRSASFELTADNHTALYIPRGFAHGFQTLTDASELLYMIDVPYAAEFASGLRWDDPAIEVTWPEPISVIAQRDMSFPMWPA